MIFGGQKKFLRKLHFFRYIRENVNLHKYSQFIYKNLPGVF